MVAAPIRWLIARFQTVQFTTNRFVRLMLFVALPAASGPGCCWCPGHGCLRKPVEQQVVVGYHHHPPFHPVPTRPVFTPNTGAYVMVSPCMITPGVCPSLLPLEGNIPPMKCPQSDCHLNVTPDGQVPSLVPPTVGAPQIELILPESAPEEVPTPDGEPNPQDRLTGRPQTVEPSGRPKTVASRPSWIFTPAPVSELNMR